MAGRRRESEFAFLEYPRSGLGGVRRTDMNPLVEQNDRFRRAADVEAEIPITAGPPIVRKWWVKRVDYLAAPPRKLDDIIREVYGMELIRYTETGDAMLSVPERQRYECE